VRTAGSSIRRLGQSPEADEVDPALDDDPDVDDESPFVVDDVSVDFDAPSPPDPLPEPLSAPVSEPFSPSDDDDPLFTADRRSFLAQPDPLKWMAGAANALRTGPDPQSGHCSGGASLTPWMTSKRRPHAAQS
jgi:hypothetical protein